MKGVISLITAFLGSLPAAALVTASSLHEKAFEYKAGYLAVYWTTEDNSVYFALSNNDDALGFQAINGGNPIVSPTLGTKAVRDTSIIAGQGKDSGKYFILGTDLNIAETTWAASLRNGSRALHVWESTDLVTWGNERLVTVEDDTAGMAWAPDAVWDEEKGQYFVHWAARLYSADDPGHTGAPTLNTSLRYAYTSDFQTFSAPQTYLTLGAADALDMSLLKASDNKILRFYVDGNVGGPVVQVSANGLFGEWDTPAGTIEQSYHFEGPYPFWDNQEAGLAYLLCDRVGTVGNYAWQSQHVTLGSFIQNNTHDLTFMRHLSVLSVTQDQYQRLSAL
ncbi:hypothetical protein ASPACDRAFT_54462 [Aspergillus aculeatus ATCC 16872]|uniref:Glycoside hydrolase family 43 protein n=1 Tax=Aspergillus aculeatus (strain ATCC 16872 / CBS 172.66 / WB 5094) TaxID=690307 RepID=A0A1L9WKB2_ASPA1|nr:uncharacterized protein ASPACDRAFT_54462 [Aspergillus aculeatus ATCC 16872]OJJ96587.1 hypothetical protein ASPACDRAFT_54462 [Aspergillus aculeatus ATCC 16872]